MAGNLTAAERQSLATIFEVDLAIFLLSIIISVVLVAKNSAVRRFIGCALQGSSTSGDSRDRFLGRFDTADKCCFSASINVGYGIIMGVEILMACLNLLGAFLEGSFAISKATASTNRGGVRSHPLAGFASLINFCLGGSLLFFTLLAIRDWRRGKSTWMLRQYLLNWALIIGGVIGNTIGLIISLAVYPRVALQAGIILILLPLNLYLSWIMWTQLQATKRAESSGASTELSGV
eukprot:PLAT15835.1.p1 GENE.PLAT15835.1~~PLAT15835.1.p1  ORF type:complete len:244 (-),score=125.76 PLAT15835.1:100-804(-)